MRTSFTSESCKESQLNSLNPQSWLQVERGKHSKFSSQSSTSSSPSIESFIKVPEPPVQPFFKPGNYVEVLAQIHEELESCSPQERSNLYLFQYQLFKGLGEAKLMRRSLRSAWLKGSTVYEKIVFGAWLKFERQGEELISDLLATCGKCAQESGPIEVSSEFDIDRSSSSHETKIASLSAPFHAMLNGCFSESLCEHIDLSENNISPLGFRAISKFSMTGSLNEESPNVLLEMLFFANKFCCERLKDACERKLASLVSSRDDAVELMECALQENSPVLAASCLQVFLQDLPDCLKR
ncbi:ETO1-RELATED [Salix purpurea]|uniref:ETO1-RELATED n=1 Tax=Salix purpurea TaxID=77065 RepID=A0A9Q1AK13_SALPP|nr:ETO1-RELATED [Salix purpurea]